MKRLKYEAFFITPSDKVIPVPLCLNHIDVICDHPEWFGFDHEHVSTVFLKYNEPWRSEKKAREELMRETYKRGYIRLRYRDNHYWIAESENLFENEKKRMQIAGWIEFMMNHQELNADEYMEVSELDTAYEELPLSDSKKSKYYFFSKVAEYPKTKVEFLTDEESR